MSGKYLLIYGMNVFDLITGVGYFSLFLLSLYSLTTATRMVKPQHLTGYRLIWTIISIIFFIILISCVFDISKTLMDNIRIIANNQGWYNYRYSFQVVFITGICAIILLIAVITEASSSVIKYNGHVIRWLIVLFTFNMINSVSLHFIDQLMNIRILGFRTERWFEISIIIISLISFICHFYDLNKKDQLASYVNPARFI